jgi:hypothetical protein
LLSDDSDILPKCYSRSSSCDSNINQLVLYHICDKIKQSLTSLRAGIKERASCFHGHGGQSTVRDLCTRVTSATWPHELVRLTGLSAEVAAANHLLCGALTTEPSSNQNLLGRGLPPDWWSLWGGVTWWTRGTRVWGPWSSRWSSSFSTSSRGLSA